MAEPAFAFSELLKLVLALGVTIGLFYALALFMKRLQVGTGKSGTLITVLGALPLGGKEKLWVVDVAGEKLVIGTTPGNVNCLHVLNSASSFPRKRESSVVDTDMETTLGPRMRDGDEVSTSSSFPRRRESIGMEHASGVNLEAGLDSRLRGNDGEVPAFAELLKRFRGWQK